MASTSDLLFRLADAIKNGDRTTAIETTERLVKLRPKLSIVEMENSINNGVRARVHIEDRETDAGCIIMYVCPSMKVRLLKEKVYMSFGFPPEVQQWIIGESLASDGDVLGDLVDVVDDITLCLYLTTAQAAGLSRKGFGDGSHERIMKNGIQGLSLDAVQEPSRSNNILPKATPVSGRPLPKILQSKQEPERELLSSTSGRPLPKQPELQIKPLLVESLKVSVPVTHQSSVPSLYQNNTQNINSRAKPKGVSDKSVDKPVRQPSTYTGKAQDCKHLSQREHWTCVRCTFAENSHMMENCSLCDAPRSYVNIS